MERELYAEECYVDRWNGGKFSLHDIIATGSA